MLHVFDGQAATLTFGYSVDGESVVPDVASVVYTLFGHNGSAINTDVAVTTTISTTSSQITIAGTDNALGGSDLANRFVRLSFDVDGQVHYIFQSYRVINFIPMTGIPDDVRSSLGINSAELLDREIDLVGAYFRLKTDLGGTILDDSLINTTAADVVIQANKAIVLTAAFDLIPVLQLRVVQREKFDTNEQWRLSEFDWDQISHDIGNQLGQAIGFLQEAANVVQTVFVVGTRTPDPFTGV